LCYNYWCTRFPSTGDQYVLETMYEHKFDRSAYQMVVGPFGGGSGSRDFACIMSLDGVVTVYEQQAFGFRTTLPNYLHPFPIKYVRSVDAFITLNADLCLVCYKWVLLWIIPIFISRERCTLSSSDVYENNNNHQWYIIDFRRTFAFSAHNIIV